MKLFISLLILMSLLLTGCGKGQQESLEKRSQKIAGEKEVPDADSDTLKADHFTLNERSRQFIDLETIVAKQQAIADIIETPAVMVPHPDFFVLIKAPVAGRIIELSAKLGNRVKADDIVAVLENPQNLGQRLIIRTPISGVVSTRPINKKEWVGDGEALLTIIDYSMLQAVIQLYPDEQEKVRIGQKVGFSGNGWSAQGIINFIAPAANLQTGTVEARADIVNSGWKIKTNLPVSAQIVVGEKSTLVVPHNALLPEEDHNIVFIQKGPIFEKRIVETGINNDELVEIVSGVKAGEKVVIRGAYQLKNIDFSSSVSMQKE